MATDTFKFRFTPEDAEERIVDLIPAQIREGLGDANWKTRLAALDEMIAWLEDGIVEEVESELVVRFLAKKGWNEKNFQVCLSILCRNDILIFIYCRSLRNYTELCHSWRNAHLRSANLLQPWLSPICQRNWAMPN